MNRLPLDIWQDIIEQGAKLGHFGALACFLRCSHFTYALTLPILYCNIELERPSQYEALFRGIVLPRSIVREPSRPLASTSNALWPAIPLDLNETNERIHEAVDSTGSDTAHPLTTSSHGGKLHALTFIRSLALNSLPSYEFSHRLCHLVHRHRHRLLLPHVSYLKIGDRVVWDLADRQNAISVEARPAVHPFTRFLTYAIRPRRVLVDLPELSEGRKADWWNARYGLRDVVGIDDSARRTLLEYCWKTYTTRGIERPLAILAQAWKPHLWALQNVSVSRGVVIPGRNNRVSYSPCLCRRSQGVGTCADHLTARDRVRNIISICGKAVQSDGQGNKTKIELANLSLGEKREEEEMKLNILGQITERGWGDMIEILFIR